MRRGLEKRSCTFSIFSVADTGWPYVVSNKMEAGVGAITDTTGMQKEKIHREAEGKARDGFSQKPFLLNGKTGVRV